MEGIDIFFNDKGKINPWAFRSSWIDKHGLSDLIAKIDDEVKSSHGIKEKVIILKNHGGVIPLCKACGKETKYHASYKKFSSYCSKKCESSSIERIASAKRYFDMPKMKKAFKEKYGKDNPMQVDTIKNKVMDTCLQVYGYDNIAKVPEVIEKIREKAIESKTDWNKLNRVHSVHMDERKSILEICTDSGYNYVSTNAQLNKYGYEKKHYLGSSIERMIHASLDSHSIVYETNVRNLIDGEIDIYIPSHKLGIEVNGLYWHNDSKKDKHHLLVKSRKCEDAGITLLHFFDTEILDKREICESMILSKLGKSESVYARKCVVMEISQSDYKDFCELNHIQGYRPAKKTFGLLNEGSLVSVMSFNNTGEMVRYCNKLMARIVGGASKLFKYAINHGVNNVYTFADKRFFDGGVYKELGFEFSHDTLPNYFYFNKDYKLQSRVKFQKHKLSNTLKNYDPNLSESINMKLNGYLRMWDCGNKKFTYNKALAED